MAARSNGKQSTAATALLTYSGKGTFVMMPIEEYHRIIQERDDALDLAALRGAQLESIGQPTQSWESVKRELGIGEFRKTKKRRKAA
ncbi:MAG: hypothetical protein ACKVZJ_14705 [Phycisphaerales bacterium]